MLAGRAHVFLPGLSRSLGSSAALGHVHPRPCRPQLALQPAAFYPADAVLAGHGAAQSQREPAQLVGAAVCALQLLRISGHQQKTPVHVAVAGMTQAARGKTVARADAHHSGDDVAKAIGRDGDICSTGPGARSPR